MKNFLLLLCMTSSLVLSEQSALAQRCERDSNLLKTRQLLSPAPYSPDSPYYNLKVACINEPYNQSVTVLVPDTFVYLGFKVPIQSVSIPLTNAIENYPVGMTYTCDPPNCVFQALSLGCILMHGTPSPINQPDTFDLAITVRVKTLLGEVPLKLPRDINPNYHYYLILRAQGQCASSIQTLEEPFTALRLMPNPSSQKSYLEAISTQRGLFQLQVLDVYGQLIQQQTILIQEGENRIPIDLSTFAAGTYLVVLSDEKARVVRRLVRL
ncbi:MAG: T9SS type A sorting domain-containing protein [Saprospiraceae bacterium]|nr:T9SS type A sorting domain-containing protein [Saprospiraceae bacterium]MDW8484640.1 T9SS type A sorting domain-containing protein [Saprospiraceae bacterium]